MYWKLIKHDASDSMKKIGCGNVKNLYVAEVEGGKIYKSEFQRIENEDHVIIHSESMVFVPNPEIQPLQEVKKPEEAIKYDPFGQYNMHKM